MVARLRFVTALAALSLAAAAAADDFELVVALRQRNLAAFERLFWNIATPG